MYAGKRENFGRRRRENEVERNKQYKDVTKN